MLHYVILFLYRLFEMSCIVDIVLLISLLLQSSDLLPPQLLDSISLHLPPTCSVTTPPCSSVLSAPVLLSLPRLSSPWLTPAMTSHNLIYFYLLSQTGVTYTPTVHVWVLLWRRGGGTSGYMLCILYVLNSCLLELHMTRDHDGRCF